MQTNEAHPLPWRLEDLPLDRIDLSRIRPREDMLYMLAAASFIEFASDTYAGNLADHYRDDPEIAAWLANQWEQEELQHGRALRAYVEAVWPAFRWEAAYAAFFEEYSKTCGIEGYEATRGLEMVARCVVETGTATLYKAIHDLADEPVLARLAEHIRSDEVRHYKHFLQFFDRYRARENNSRFQVLQALRRRLVEARHGDAEIGLWHAFHDRHPDERRDGDRFTTMQHRVARLVGQHYPAHQAIRMMMKPLRLPNVFAALLAPLMPPLANLLRAALLR